MKQALFTSKNLIGDALYISAPLRAWHEKNPEYEITILTLPDHVKELYEGMGVSCTIVTTLAELVSLGYDFEFTFDVNRAFQIGEQDKCHIAVAYAKMLGVEIKEVGPFYEAPLYIVHMGPILISPFSQSCASNQGKPPNKMLPRDKWLPIIKFLRTLGVVEVLGAKNNDVPAEWRFDEYAKILGNPLPEVARLLKYSKLLVTVDNGIAHLAASQGTPTIVFYPDCLGLHWITPVGNPKAVVIQFDPVEVSANLLLKKVKEVILHDLKLGGA